MDLKAIRKNLREHSSKEKAAILQKFFKTGPGEYAQNDKFIGVKVPQVRKLAGKCYNGIILNDLSVLLKSPIHEERLLALLILIFQYRKALSEAAKEEIYDFYLNHISYINNWDLVDLSAGHIIGAFLMNRDKKLLYDLACSSILWEKRIAIVSTSYFIKNRHFSDTLKIAQLLLTDSHDLIHKAVGWMLREVGKRSLDCEERFLKKYYQIMPRTMLRYAIERFPEPLRQSYLKGKILVSK